MALPREVHAQVSKQQRLLDSIKQTPLENILSNADINYGMPGPVVHYVEKFYMKGYEDLLLSSIERKPTIHTLWMFNRILNSPKLIDREKYIQVLKEVVDNSMESEDIRNEAKQYLQFQNGR